MIKSVVTWLAVLAVYLFVLAGPAGAQVPKLVDGAWVMPTPHQHAASSSDYVGMIEEACAYWGCSPDYLISVMNCESHGDPNATAYNPASGNYTVGLFQIDEMWGVGYDPAAQVWFAAEHLTKGDVWWACG